MGAVEPLDVLAAMPAAAGQSGSGSVRVRLLPQSLAVAVGDVFEVAVEIATTVPVAHTPMTLSYDPGLLAVEGVEAGDFLGHSKNAEVTADDSSPGAIVIGASRVAGASGVAGHGTLATIRFRALSDGVSAISVDALRVMDPGLSEIGVVSTSPSEVAVGDVDAPAAREIDGAEGDGGS